jgi:acyl-CoA synthetase (AMP-forming)/AMP-acid ligase II/NAD(P)-dependent dehydrogenase (short-subunit alcohol dehydrogenase family)
MITEAVFGPPRPDDSPAVVDLATDTRWTYGELREDIGRAVHGLRAAGVGPGDRVGLALPNGADFVITLHALLAVGAVASPVSPLTPPVALERQLASIGAKRLITAGFRRASPSGPPLLSGSRAADLALLPFSSGSTGLPKPVAITHGNLVAGLVQLAAAQPLRPDDVILGVLPFCHMFGLQYLVNHPLHSGARLVTMPRYDTEAMLAAIARYRVTLLYTVPPMVRDLARQPHLGDLTSLEQIVCGGAPLSPADADRCEQRLGVPVDEAYGLTEVNTSHLTARGGVRKRSSVGMPVPGTDCKIVRDGAARAGELHLRGAQVAAGYLRDGRTEPITDEDGWLATGDLAYHDEDGLLFITGRLKEIIKYKGFQVSPAELEAVLKEHPDIEDAAVAGVPDRDAGQLPKAFIVAKDENNVSHEQILAFAAQRLAPHKRPRIIETVDAIPRTAAGKVIRHELPLASLRGRTVVITGGTRGFGHVLARHFARQRARVIITGRSRTVLTAAEELACHGDVRGFVSDIADLRGVCDLVGRLEPDYGGIDVLVNNAALPGPSGEAWNTDPDDWQTTFDVNVAGVLGMCRAVIPGMCTRGHGRIVNIVSNAGKHRWPHMSAYSVSKAAVIKLTENLDAELRPYGIAVFNYDPGLLTIGMATRQLDQQHPPGSWDARIRDWYLEQHNSGKTVSADQAARNLLLLAAGMADTRSGQYLTVHDDFTAS